MKGAQASRPRDFHSRSRVFRCRRHLASSPRVRPPAHALSSVDDGFSPPWHSSLLHGGRRSRSRTADGLASGASRSPRCRLRLRRAPPPSRPPIAPSKPRSASSTSSARIRSAPPSASTTRSSPPPAIASTARAASARRRRPASPSACRASKPRPRRALPARARAPPRRTSPRDRRSLSVQPPIDAAHDWALVRLSAPVCKGARLPMQPACIQ